MEFDALVVGGGIAGLQAALDLADQDFKVAIVEKDASIGGKMIRLSKVFPTQAALPHPRWPLPLTMKTSPSSPTAI